MAENLERNPESEGAASADPLSINLGTRREFLVKSIAGALGAAAILAIGGCHNDPPKKPSDPVSPTPVPRVAEPVELKRPPEITFEKVEKPNWLPEPEAGMPELTPEQVIALGNKLVENFNLYWDSIRNLSREQQAQSLRNDFFRIIIEAFLKFDANFQAFFDNKQTFFLQDNYALVDLVNRAMISAGFYLYADFRSNKYEIYPVLEYGTFESDREYGGRYVMLGDGLHYPNEKGKAGNVLKDDLDMVHVWPDAPAHYKIDGRILANEDPEWGLNVARDYLYHEATHSVLLRAFPNLQEGRFTFHYRHVVDERRRIAIFFEQLGGGSTNANSLHEMAAVGAQLAQSSHPLEIIPFLGETEDPNYQMARQCLAVILIKNLPTDLKLRADCLTKFDSGSPMDMPAIFAYLEKQRDLELTHQVGHELYDIAIRLLEKWPTMSAR